MAEYNWPYPDEFGQTETVDSDILVLGGGLAGCFAAIAAARKGKKVVLVEKGATKRSGAAGTGFDHWESACTNPCSQVTPEEIANACVDEQDHYSNGIAHYIECREGYDRMLDLESFGGKIRDTEDEFKGAEAHPMVFPSKPESSVPEEYRQPSVQARPRFQRPLLYVSTFADCLSFLLHNTWR